MIEIKYIIDLDINLAKKVAKTTNSQAFSKINPSMNFDICLIATPPSTRLPIFKTLLDKKCCVIFEKPLALDFPTSQKINNLAKLNNIPIYVAQTRRFFPNLRFIRKFIKNGFFSGPLNISVYEGGIFGWQTESNYLNTANNKDHGVINDIGSHVIDFILQILYDNDESIIFSNIESFSDYPTHANNFECKFQTNGVFKNIYVKLSRNILLSNKIVISDKNGNSLISDSSYSKQITISRDKFNYTINYDEDGKLSTFENTFDLMWESLINNHLPDKKTSNFDDMNAATVLEMMKLIDILISEKKSIGELNLLFAK